jgi:hypothetical protein
MLKKNLRPDIKVIPCDLHIDDVEFAYRAAEVYADQYREKK